MSRAADGANEPVVGIEYQNLLPIRVRDVTCAVTIDRDIDRLLEHTGAGGSYELRAAPGEVEDAVAVATRVYYIDGAVMDRKAIGLLYELYFLVLATEYEIAKASFTGAHVEWGREFREKLESGNIGRQREKQRLLRIDLLVCHCRQAEGKADYRDTTRCDR